MAGDYRNKPRQRQGKKHSVPAARPSSKRGDRSKRAGDSSAVVVNGYSEEWLQRDFPWVYRNEIESSPRGLKAGQCVHIQARSGKPLGTGIWAARGRVAIRRYRCDTGPIDRALLSERIACARQNRPIPANTTAWRWVHAENDRLPGVRVDVWKHQLNITLDSPALLSLLPTLVDVLSQQHQAEAIWLNWRPMPELSPQEFQALQRGLVWGQAEEQDIEVLENGLRFLVRPWCGPDAGLYCDMRQVRTWLAPHWRDRKVLNLFAFSGAYSVSAACHGASEVVSVDLSSRYLDWAKANFSLNGLDPNQHRFIAQDAFKALDNLRRRGERFHTVVVDPPSFSHGDGGIWSTKKGFARLVAACLRVLEPGGWLVAASNHGQTSPKQFQGQIIQGAARVDRPLRLIHQGSPPLDFPALLTFPESRYLKCWVMQA